MISPVQPRRATNTVGLDRVRRGDEGRVTRVVSDTSIAQRLMVMGLMPGAHVKVVRVAPLGDPITLEGAGSQLCVLSREEAAFIIEYAHA